MDEGLYPIVSKELLKSVPFRVAYYKEMVYMTEIICNSVVSCPGW